MQFAQGSQSQQNQNYKKASFLQRFIAILLDGLIIFIINIAIFLLAIFINLPFLKYLTYLVAFIYSIYFIGSKGSTPGMIVLKIKALNTKYQKVGYGAATGRALASILSSMVMNIGYLWVLIDRKRQTWHDKLANTYVVKLDNNNLIPITQDDQITTWQKIFFALVAIALPLISILAVLFAVTLIAINPAKQFSQANDTKRQSDVNAIANALWQYKAYNNNQLPQGITNTPQEISSRGLDLCTNLLPKYLPYLPVDPSVNQSLSISNCRAPYETGYTVSLDSQGRVTVTAPKAELNRSISVTR